ncbi:SDR family oxidoreductase [Achromobacter sp. GG226]|uniref:SDR family NAD(P)-dependent oxidoreductase n=1 Tax=Verticiella alkaliphila TaxID=2779529 RepID=UPI001C0B67DE|nr:SDR family oxidoreductase [Verticiella sp. GG226]MBU4611483.1 SDR family oxidoreductase [Verticiella sp. GG226]
MHRRFQDKIVVVFGAGSSGPGWGNGKAAAALYAREGAHVYAIDIAADAARETAAAIASEGNACTPLTADVTHGDQIAEVVRQVLAQHDRIDVLHNNVGITAMGDPVEASEESWHRVLDTNLTGVFLTCKHVLPSMMEHGGGSIVNISSLASIQVNQYPYTSYYAAKGGLNQMTRSLAVHYAPHGIRVNAVLPGVIDTPLIYQQIAGQFQDVEAMRAKRNAASPMQRMGTAWDVAKAALFLASDDAAYITGVCLPVDGGKACWGR